MDTQETHTEKVQISASNELDVRESEPQEWDQLRRASSFGYSHKSSINLADDYTCPLSQHQYHYIQYPNPAAYYEHINQQAQLPPPTVNSCRCRCSCVGGDHPREMVVVPKPQHYKSAHSQQSSVDSQMSVAVIVHRQAGSGSADSTKAQSEQSLLHHSYQTLVEEKPLNKLGNSKLNISCECDLKCTCSADVKRPTPKNVPTVIDVMLAADEITVSESDNNSTMIKKKKSLTPNRKLKCSWYADVSTQRSEKKCAPNCNSSHVETYSDGEVDAVNMHPKDNNMPSSNNSDHRPPLPPRPPPRPRNVNDNPSGPLQHGHGIKKYVVWCLLCGGFSCLLGILFLGVYFLLHSYTITVGNFETVPTFVPAALLILTGLCIMSLARRKNRYSYLIKLSGACGLISALTCALVTVTTTVLHMSRLQALRECEYAQKTRTCTCYSDDMVESHVDKADKEGVRLVFDSLSDCGVVHGSLYSCLRAIFGLSVAGVLIAVFSCMLVYQLLSHERKKMYWEQLELRCRSLYTSQQGPPNVAGSRGCRCCEQCHAHRQMPVVYPWVTDDGSGEPRFWTSQPPGNFYSPNPGREELHLGTIGTCRGTDTSLGPNVSGTRGRATSGWSWPRLPWQRNSPETNSHFRQAPSSPDSQYGFSNIPAPLSTGVNVAISEEAASAVVVSHNTQPFNMTPGEGYGIWGPPPPYSDPNSPARYYQYIQTNLCNHDTSNCSNNTHNDRPTLNIQHITEQQATPGVSHHRSALLDAQTIGVTCCVAQQNVSVRHSAKRQVSSNPKHKNNVNNYENTPSDSDCGNVRDRFSNTLPTRKIKKRVETGAGVKSIGPNFQLQRVSVQQVFADPSGCESEHSINASTGNSESFASTGLVPGKQGKMNAGNSQTECNQALRHKLGFENSAFQNNTECIESSIKVSEVCDPTESEVYFADVSSCCNMSVKNDNYYEEANRTISTLQQHDKHQQQVPHQRQSSICSHNGSCQEDYLAQRFGERENSIRSRLPFPQTPLSDKYEDAQIQGTTAPPIINTNASVCNHMTREISRQSMCSVESETKTEFTDLSPSTPCSNTFAQQDFSNATVAAFNSTGTTSAAPNFIASFPSYSSESKSLEAHRRPTKNMSEKVLSVANEAQYEIINETNNTASPIIKNTTHRMLSQRSCMSNVTGNKRENGKAKSKCSSRERLDAHFTADLTDTNAEGWPKSTARSGCEDRDGDEDVDGDDRVRL